MVITSGRYPPNKFVAGSSAVGTRRRMILRSMNMKHLPRSEETVASNQSSSTLAIPDVQAFIPDGNDEKRTFWVDRFANDPICASTTLRLQGELDNRYGVEDDTHSLYHTEPHEEDWLDLDRLQALHHRDSKEPMVPYPELLVSSSSSCISTTTSNSGSDDECSFETEPLKLLPELAMDTPKADAHIYLVGNCEEGPSFR